ncbi:hypothetical protein [Lactococcus kimchii]|uniref:hypothetical protein n=1 Tax=Lactococcus sp. S-13 TaxID=2507158 RepID=UPI001022B397|nr:hypothetical protein [Lactococcus sp. S-13]RZI47890.1 hypothetical protein EQJ87_10740 [Lactococcus sp. S-13]
MKYDFVNNNAAAKNNQEQETVEIATSEQTPQASPTASPLSAESFDFMEFIQGERKQALEEETQRHEATKKEINRLFNEMERLEKARPEAIKQARDKAKKTLEAIKGLISERSQDVEDEVSQVAIQLREKTNVIVGELENEEL